LVKFEVASGSAHHGSFSLRSHDDITTMDAASDAELSTFIAATLGAAVDVGDPAAVSAALVRVGQLIAKAEAEVVRIVEAEKPAVERVLGCADELRGQVETLQDGVLAIECNALRERLEASVLRAPALRERLHASQDSLMLLRCLAAVHRSLGGFETALGANDFRGAAALVAALRERDLPVLLEHPEMTRDRAATGLLDVIISEVERSESRLHEAALAAWAAAALGRTEIVIGDPTTHSAETLVLSADSSRLHMLVGALSAIGAIDGCMRKLGEAAMARLLRPAFERSHVAIRAARTEDDLAVALVVCSSAEADDDASLGISFGFSQRAAQVCEAIETVLGALHDFLAGVSGSAASEPLPGAVPSAAATLSILALGPTFWGELRRAVVEDCLLPALAAEMMHARAPERPMGEMPSASRAPGASAAPIATSRGRVHAMAASVSTRVVALHERLQRRVAATSPMVAAALSAELGMLVEAAARLEARAAAMRCEEVLHDGRRIIYERSADSVELPASSAPLSGMAACDAGAAGAPAAEHDGDPPAKAAGVAVAARSEAHCEVRLGALHFPRCRVSTRATRLLRLLDATLEDACACGPEGAGLLYARARDVIDLFLAAAPHRSAEVLVPHVALLLHNDARLLRHRCLTLGLQYARRLPPPIGGAGGSASFVDLAPELQALAARTFEAVLHEVQQQLFVALSGARGFVRVGEDAEAHAHASAATRQLIHHTRRLHRMALETLPRPTAMELLGRAVEAPLGSLCAQVLGLRHISDADSRALQAEVFTPLCAACDALLQPAPEDAPATGHGGADGELGDRDGRASDPNAAAEAEGGGDVYAPSLRMAKQLSRVLGADRLRHVREQWELAELDALPARDLLALLRAIYPNADLATNPEARSFVDALAEAAAQTVTGR